MIPTIEKIFIKTIFSRFNFERLYELALLASLAKDPAGKASREARTKFLPFIAGSFEVFEKTILEIIIFQSKSPPTFTALRRDVNGLR